MATFFSNSIAGGMNEVIDPGLLDEKSAALLVNADISTGKIRSIKMPRRLGASNPEDLHHYGKINRSVVKWYGRNYWSINDTFTAPFYGGDAENYLGIPFPVYDRDVNLSTVEGDLTGEYKYCVTFVNPNGWESAPGDLLDYERAITLKENYVDIKVTWDDARISYAKIYRTIEHGADFYCVGEIKKSGDVFKDQTDDYTLAGLEPLGTIDNYPPPDNGKYLCESGGVFFLAVGSTLYFSSLGNPHAWPKLNFVGFDDLITGVTPEFQGVLVYTLNNTYRIVGAEDIETLTKQLLPGNQGCVNYNSIAQVSNAPVWLSNDGICLWDGESITVISQQIVNTTRLPVVCAVSANDCYFLFLTSGAILYDHRNGDIFSKLDFTCSYAWYDSTTDNLYLQQGDSISVYGGGGDAIYTYMSPRVVFPESVYKYIKEVTICVEGSANVTLTNESGAIFSVALNESGRHRLKAPYNTMGRWAQMKVVGIGSLSEISVTYE
jgi:hypothetical protein